MGSARLAVLPSVVVVADRHDQILEKFERVTVGRNDDPQRGRCCDSICPLPLSRATVGARRSAHRRPRPDRCRGKQGHAPGAQKQAVIGLSVASADARQPF